MERPRPAILDWYRVDETRAVATVVTQGAFLLLAGAMLLGHAFAGAVPEGPLRVMAYVIGAVCVPLGPLQTILGFQRIMAVDTYLAMRTDGVFLHDPSGERLVEWDDLTDVRAAEGALELQLRSGEPIRLTSAYGDLPSVELAKRMNAFRRKAQWNLLPGMRSR